MKIAGQIERTKAEMLKAEIEAADGIGNAAAGFDGQAASI